MYILKKLIEKLKKNKNKIQNKIQKNHEVTRGSHCL